MKVDERKYQSRDKKDIKKAFTNYRSVLYQCPTGGGKSVVATDLVDEWIEDNGKVNILVMAHRRELLQQFDGHFSGRDIKVGMMQGKIERNMDANVVVASVFTATRDTRLKTLLKRKWDYIIVDECHRIMSESYAKPIREIREVNSECKLLGLTATPYRLDGKNLSEQFDKIICSDDISTLIKNGYLADHQTFATPVQQLMDVEKTNSGSDYKQEPLSAYMRTKGQIEYLVESYRLYGKEKQMIVYCVDRKHAMDVANAYRKSNIAESDRIEEYNEMAHVDGKETMDLLTVGYLDGNTPTKERESMLDAFRKGILRIIVSIDTLTEGIDLPETGVIQLARPTLSLSLYLQMVGRGLRPKADGSKLIILDNAGCSDSFGLVSSPKKWSLDSNIDPNKPREGNKVVAIRKDGSYETDLDEAEFLELREMTHEEFVDKVINSEESAKKHNDEVDEKIKNMTLELGEAILEAAGAKAYEIPKKDYWNKTEITCNHKKEKSFTIEIKIDYEKGEIDFYNGFTRYRGLEVDYKFKAMNAIMVGAFYGQMITNKSLKKMLKSMMAAIVLIELTKIDLYKLDEKIRNAKEDALVHSIESHLAKNKEIIMKPKEGDVYWRYKRLDHFYVSLPYQFGGDVVRMVFERDGLFSKNPITIYDEEGKMIYESKSTKKDKILEIMRGCNPIFKN